MTVKTGGRLRGLVSRWLMRFEASSQIFRIGFLGITAASTLTTALIGLGLGNLAPYVLAIGLLATPGFAYAYVELGFFNRKNRERVDRGDNFAGPGFAMNKSLEARQRAVIAEAIVENYGPEEIRDRMDEETAALLNEFRDGVNVTEIYESGHIPRGEYRTDGQLKDTTRSDT